MYVYVRSWVTKVPQQRKFQGANIPRNETGEKVLSVDFLLPGTKVQRNEKAWIQHEYRIRRDLITAGRKLIIGSWIANSETGAHED